MENFYLDEYRKFFESFALSVDPFDQLPVKVAGYNLFESEIVGAAADWALQYLEQRRCPPFLLAHLVREVVDEVKVMCKADPESCGYRSELNDFLSLKLMQACISKVISVCGKYKDNAQLSSLPPPQPLPPVTSYAVKNSRRSMEDRHVIIHDFHTLFNIKGYGPASYYAVFDGHNGIDAAIYSVSHLHQYLAESRHYPTNPILALKEACKATDDLFTLKAERENLHGGTTAVFALLRHKEKKLYVAWLGDSQAVLVRQGVPMQIVRPHKPDRTDERERIEKMGGSVLYWGTWRVNGQLAVSRAIGDIEYKPYVSATPDIEEITLNGTEDFLILACDGLWDFVSEREATNAVYEQLQQNAEDLEAVSHRLVALAKQQCSQDNISVVVVFLADPAKVAQRRPMETTVPSPPNHFGARNGADLYCGQFDHESEDFGPETDVDMVDDVLLSPAITAAKKLVQGKDIEDDLERQRQQLSDFDDPADGDRSRDTPTPPAHEVGSNATVDPLGDSGEESEDEEWNYVPGKDPKPSNTEEEDDMSSQLNPNAAEFVPVSPTRLLMLDDAIISASGYEKSLDNVQLPSELEFDSEIKHRPGDLEFTNGHKHVDDYFMRDNFSTLRNKGKDFNVSSTCAEFGDSSILSFKTSSDTSMTECISENIPFDKLVPVKNFEEDKENLLEPSNDLTNSSFGTTNLFGKGDPMTTSVMGFTSSPEPENEDSAFPGTPKSTTVEAPVSPLNDDVSPLNLQTDLEPSKEDLMANEPMSPVGGVQEKASSLGFGSESETEEVAHEDNEGFVLEHRRSPPIDLSFKPIQTFSDTNPFGALQTPSVTTPMDQLGESSLPLENHNSIEESSKVEEVNRYSNDMFDITSNSPVSFISLRSPTKEEQVPFDELESPKDELHFEPLPNANSSMIPKEVPNSPEPEKPIEESTLVETTPAKENCKSFEDLDTTAGFMEVESKVLLDEQEHEQVSKITDETTVETSEPTKLLENGVDSPSENEIVVEKVLTAFDDIKDEFESHEEKKELDLEVETREMKLEFESHIAPLDISPDDLKNIDEGFEVISKEELETSNSDHNGPNECSLPPNDVSGIVDLPSPTAQTNPFVTDNDFSANLLETKNEPKSDLMNAIENFGSALENDLIKPEHLIKPEQSAQLTSSTDILPSIEPEAEKTFSYQTLTPADEPKLTKVEAYVTGVDENLIETLQEAAENLVDKSQTFEDNFLEKPQVIEENFVVTASVPEEPKAPVFDEPSLVQSEQIQSQVVTETLIQTLEEKSEVQSLATTEVPSSTDTPPSTPAPGLEDKDDIQKTDILVAAVAAAGAVAAGTAVVAEKEAKKASPAPIKKPAVTMTKKLDTAPKAPAKTVPAKAPAAKPAPTKTTTKPATTTTKPATTTATSKPAASKPASTVAAAKKPAPTTTTLKSSPAKPITTTTSKPATTSAPKPAANAPKQVPKQLPVNKTSTLTMKPGSKPTTPTSKPTTPTTPKSPSVLKTDVKSPSRPAVKSTLAAKPMSKPTGPAEKKPLTNGDVKPLAKKTEDVVKKPLTATKTTTARPASAPVSKTAVPPVKAATTGINKAAPTKPTTTTQPKPKAPTTTAATKPAVPPPIRRPTSATVPKPSEKPSKETANKLISNTKPATNGKAVPAKTAAATKKTDVKMNGKNVPVKVVPKKAEEVKKEEESEIKIQEDNVTTTNGFADHIIEENGSMKFEELTPVILDGVN